VPEIEKNMMRPKTLHAVTDEQVYDAV